VVYVKIYISVFRIGHIMGRTSENLST